MRLRDRFLTGCAAALFLVFIAGTAHATSSTDGFPSWGSRCDPIQEDVQSGPLWFSDFCFYSPGRSVDPDDLTITFNNADGVVDVIIESIDPLTPRNGWAKFYVSYEVTAVDPIIYGASLALDSSVNSSYSAVFDTTRVIGEGPDEQWGNGHGWGHLGWGLLSTFGDHSDRRGKTIAFLKTAEWTVGGGCLRGLGWDWLCDGGFPLDERSFDPQENLKVIDGVWVKVGKDGEAEFWSRNRFNVVPEPATAALLGLGLLGLSVAGRRY